MEAAVVDKKKPNLVLRVIISALLGIATGLFFGDRIEFLQPIGTVYTMLLEAVVYPYLIATLLQGLGDLTPNLARKFFKSAWGVYFLLIFITFSTILLLSIAIPVNSTNLSVTQLPKGGLDLLNLLIPANLFYSLAQNYVPAVVVFTVLFGMCLQHIKAKRTLLDPLQTISDTCLKFWEWLVQFAPICVFALVAVTTGSVKGSQIVALSEYLALYFAGTLILCFLTLPALIASLTPVGYRDVLKSLRSAFILCAATTLSVLSLPYVQRASKQFIEQHCESHPDTDDVIGTAVTISYPFAQLGNFFLYLFILFAAFYFSNDISPHQRTILPLISYLATIGSPSTVFNATVFFSQWLHLSSQTSNLFVSILPLTRYGQILISVMGFMFFTLLSTFAYHKRLEIKVGQFLVTLLGSLLLFAGIGFAVMQVSPNIAQKSYLRLNQFSIAPNLHKNLKVKVFTSIPTNRITNTSNGTLLGIEKAGILRVGYNANNRPFSFFNHTKQLVGYDVAYIYALAHALHVSLEFIPYQHGKLTQDLIANKFDIGIGGIFVTEKRLNQTAFTEAYLHSPPVIIVRKGKTGKFQTPAKIQAMPNLLVGGVPGTAVGQFIVNRLPNAHFVPIQNLSKSLLTLFKKKKITIAILPKIQAEVWVMGHPHYAIAYTKFKVAPTLIAYMIQRKSTMLLRYINYWLTLQKEKGFAKLMYNHWILAEPINQQKPRWNILSNVILKNWNHTMSR